MYSCLWQSVSAAALCLTLHVAVGRADDAPDCCAGLHAAISGDAPLAQPVAIGQPGHAALHDRGAVSGRLAGGELAGGGLVVGQGWRFGTGPATGAAARSGDVLPDGPASHVDALQAKLRLAALWTF